MNIQSSEYKEAKKAHRAFTLVLLFVTALSSVLQITASYHSISEDTYMLIGAVLLNAPAYFSTRRWVEILAGLAYALLGIAGIPILFVLDFGYGLGLMLLAAINCWLLFNPYEAGKFLLDLTKTEFEG